RHRGVAPDRGQVQVEVLPNLRLEYHRPHVRAHAVGEGTLHQDDIERPDGAQFRVEVKLVAGEHHRNVQDVAAVVADGGRADDVADAAINVGIDAGGRRGAYARAH